MEIMDLKQELIDRLGVPDNWDKHDHQTQRYSFDDVQEVLEDIVNKIPIHDVSCCAEQTKNVLTNKVFNIVKEHVGKTFDEVPEATDLLKAIDVIEKHCS